MSEHETNLRLMGRSNLNLPVNFLQRLIEERQEKRPNHYQLAHNNVSQVKPNKDYELTLDRLLNATSKDKYIWSILTSELQSTFLVLGSSPPGVGRFNNPGFADRMSNTVIGIVDVGIPFWRISSNPEDASEAQFKAMGFVELNTSPPLDNANRLVFNEFYIETDHLFDPLKDPGKATKLFAEIATKHPGSIYVHQPHETGLIPADFSHGTAMADIAGRDKDGSGTTSLVGVELPREAVLDTSGETLSFVCEFAINKLVELALNSANLNHLIVLLPYGFTGGPHDGSHPIVKSIETALANSDLGIRVSLVLPTGNHLQSQSHAVIEATGPDQATEPLSVIIPPDDHSDNKFDLVTKAFTPPILTLRSPKGEEFTVCFDKGLKGFQRNNLWYANDEMLAVNLQIPDLEICDCDDDDSPFGHEPMQFKYQIIIGKTVISPDLLPGTAGEWTISLKSSDDRPLPASSCWILRDDMPIASGRMPPRRQAMFVDDEYRTTSIEGLPITNDRENASCVKREGTASVITTLNPATPNIYRVGAAAPGAACPTRANYSGAMIGRQEDDLIRVDPNQADEGTEAMINALGEIGRVSGTSVAAALKARELALSSK